MRFVADSTVGKLAKWLRVMGCDTHLERSKNLERMDNLVREGRIMVSRDRQMVKRYENAVWIQSDRVRDQLLEMKSRKLIPPARERWFSRCLVCNVPLRDARSEVARQNVPEYVAYKTNARIRYCPVCGRYFWPGTHRKNMIKQLQCWGIVP